MFERFTERARRVIVLAREEARLLDHDHIGTEHLLLGVVADDGDAAGALADLGLDLATARREVEDAVGRGAAPPSGHVPFSPRAKKALGASPREARDDGHHHIRPARLLLGLLHEGDGVAARALESMGIALEAVRSQVEEIIGEGALSPSDHLPFTPRAKKVLELSLREAMQLGHNYIGTEHILLGLVREGEGVAAQVLVKLDADLSRVRQQVIQLLSGYAGGKAAASAGTGPGET